MRTIRTKVYQFNELSDEAKQVAIENERNNEYNVELYSFQENAKERIEEVGFYDGIELQYSLNYCQGDGLSFNCGKIKESVLLSFFAEILGTGKEKTAKTIMEYCSFTLKSTNHHYCYASKGDIRYEFDDYYANHPQIHTIVGKVEEKLENLYMELCKELEKQGYDEIEYQQSDECISEKLISNEIDFTKDGKIFNS